MDVTRSSFGQLSSGGDSLLIAEDTAAIRTILPLMRPCAIALASTLLLSLLSQCNSAPGTYIILSIAFWLLTTHL